MPPAEWVIVNDGSTDRTGEIIDQYAAQFPFIRAIHRPIGDFGRLAGESWKRFTTVTTLPCEDWEFVAKLMGTLVFPRNTFNSASNIS